MCCFNAQMRSFSLLSDNKRDAVCCHPKPSLVQSPLHSSAPVGYMGCHPYTTHTQRSRLRACFAMWAAACHVTKGQWAAAPASSPVNLMFGVPSATPAPSHAIQPLHLVSQSTHGGTGAVLWQLVSDCGGGWGMREEELHAGGGGNRKEISNKQRSCRRCKYWGKKGE